jgi:hypothetical protein
MNIRNIYPLLLALMMLTFLSCNDVKESDVAPEASFNRIYNSQNPEDNIYPVDIIQTPDKGYLVVSEIEERSVGLLKTDAKGNVVSQAKFPGLKSPLQGVFKIGEDFYFFCRDELEYTVAVKVDMDTLANSTPNLLIINFPLSVGRTSDGFLIQSWNQKDRATIVYKVNESRNGPFYQQSPDEERAETAISDRRNSFGTILFQWLFQQQLQPDVSRRILEEHRQCCRLQNRKICYRTSICSSRKICRNAHCNCRR